MAFIETRSRHINTMQAVLKEYEESSTGARHIHLATDDPEMVFLVAFPTVPDKSDGRAHILEHLALCGSARYPVRDPFFSMLRRSTSTFMNAMTYPDRTVYPFASTDPKDFFNLLGIYLDAAFFPRLDYLDFRQEGWRHTLEDGKLGYGGVVFNEMKGAFADPTRALAHAINEHLLKGTTYEFESGGDPLVIPSLTYDDLKAFHASHYHPSQAVFMTAGRVDPLTVQRVISEQVLDKLSGTAPRKMPELASAWTQPQETSIAVPSPTAEGDEHGIQLAWLMGEMADTMSYCRGHLLESGLIGDASAPVLHAMESAGYGRPSVMNGLDSGCRQMLFHIGMEGLTREQISMAKQRIWDALEKTAGRGVPQAVLQAALRDLRFSQREVRGGDTPYGLRKLLHALPLEMAGEDCMVALDSEATLRQLDEQIRDPEFFKSLVRELLESPTRLTVSVIPDAKYFDERQQAEEAALAKKQASLPQEEIARIKEECEALLARQRQPLNNEVLPRIRPEDVSPMPRALYALPAPQGPVLALPIASNGISYANVSYAVSSFPEEDWPWLDLYAELVPDLGVGKRTYEDAGGWRQQMVTEFDVKLEAEERIQSSGAAPGLNIRIAYSAKNVREEQAAIADVLSESIRAARFDEQERIAFLIDSIFENIVQELAEEGDQYASLAAEAPFSIRRRFEDSVEGLGALRFYRVLSKQIESEEGLQAICERLEALHQRIQSSAVQVVVAGMESDVQALAGMMDVPGTTPALNSEDSSAKSVQNPSHPANVALLAPGQVNHCYATWQVPQIGHPDAPVLSVLANLLTNGVLHQALREEGGAYGGRAKYVAQSGLFTMLSYRDPRLAGTYEDFMRAIAWAVESPLSREHIEEAIIGTIGELDKPYSPYQEAMIAWRMQQRGITQAMREQFRAGVLQCTDQELRDVAKKYLQNVKSSKAAFAGNGTQNLAGLERVDLLALAA
ncbi:insulinase family protein [Oxalobacteraceae bacterium R-40]|uniref:Insulinase family protein n=1 Tax=Keguizhuia sedimenti TaxID=3064264 RepID=A0ABU1BQY5_9BURK|nr:insulinase family protein [Oxalobacteraceae bacterium R-40]